MSRSYLNTAPRENKTSWVSDLERNTYKPERKASFVSEITSHKRMVRLIRDTLGHSRNTGMYYLPRKRRKIIHSREDNILKLIYLVAHHPQTQYL
jgi:hypothetical protein